MTPLAAPRHKSVSTPSDTTVVTVSAVPSAQVLRGQQELHIHHGGAIYTLRVTRQGKLILTK